MSEYKGKPIILIPTDYIALDVVWEEQRESKVIDE